MAGVIDVHLVDAPALFWASRKDHRSFSEEKLLRVYYLSSNPLQEQVALLIFRKVGFPSMAFCQLKVSWLSNEQRRHEVLSCGSTILFFFL